MAAVKRENIQVYIRVRPMTENEERQKQKDHNRIVVEVNKADKNIIIVPDRNNLEKKKTFVFNEVFGPNRQQAEVFEKVALPMVTRVLEGYNGTIFAYGQTGSGKTFTMEGGSHSLCDQESLNGLVPRIVCHLLEELKQKNHKMTVSYLEIYNEELIDLLSSDENKTKLRLLEDNTHSRGSVIVQGISDVLVTHKEQVFDILSRGAKKRQTAATLMNATSSRSHGIFMITIQMCELTEAGQDLIKTGKINLVDLAGSESIGRSGATNLRAKEACNINQSLLTLGRVITALVEKKVHVPYRDAKLTRLLRDSLGGNTKTAIVATISPVLSNLEETLMTLDYAHRAKSIVNRPQICLRPTKQVLDYEQKIEHLRQALIAARARAGPDNKELEQIIEQKNKELLDKTTIIKSLEEKVMNLTDKLEKMAVTLATDKELTEKTQIIRSLEADMMKKEALVSKLSLKLKDLTEKMELMEREDERQDLELMDKTKVIKSLKEEVRNLSEKLNKMAANPVVTEGKPNQKEIPDKHLNTEAEVKSTSEKVLSVTKATTRDLQKTHEATSNKENVNQQSTPHKIPFNTIALDDSRIRRIKLQKKTFGHYVGGIAKLVCGQGNEHQYSLYNKKKTKLPDHVVENIIAIVKSSYKDFEDLAATITADTKVEIPKDDTKDEIVVNIIKSKIERHLRYEGDKVKQIKNLGKLLKDLEDLLLKGHAIKDHVREIQRLASTMSGTCGSEVIPLLWTSAMSQDDENVEKELVAEQALKHLKAYAPVFTAFTQSAKSKQRLMLTVQEYCFADKHVKPLFSSIIKELYELEVLSAEDIRNWYDGSKSTKGKLMFRNQIKTFVYGLPTGMEDSESD
ncbi:kinesin-like protein KIF11-B [Neocloeon triangulifer]|uniref:kinesin-like protein KIF11-B n=1 Tax=Neocloeon triangulifer TaxID=2078957 RepID=UPI00286F81E4|nr:kinesin-like protein KIF11-B [Neocloeon triangulifer]